MPIVYQEQSIDDVVRYFAKDFKTRPGQKVHVVEFFVDTMARKVIFKFHIEETKAEKALSDD